MPTDPDPTPRPARRRLAPVLIVLGVLLLVPVIGLGLFRATANLRDSAELERADRELRSGRFQAARDRLEVLVARRPDRAAFAFALARSESALGNVEAALDAWALVPADSPIAPQASLERARLALDHGRLDEAEESLRSIADRPDEIGVEAIRLTQRLLLFSGRSDDLAEWFERQWLASRPTDPGESSAILRSRWLAETQALPIDAVAEGLADLHRKAPDDDRVWLGLADLARRSGRLDEADRWLSRCEERRPEDPEVALVRLEWALAADRLDRAERSLRRIPASRLSSPRILAIEARFAALRGDTEAERSALTRLVAIRPEDPNAWGRLADLAARDGDDDQRSRFRSRKRGIDQARDEYSTLMGDVGAGDLRPLADLARLAETLGRRVEALGWWTLAARRDPLDEEARNALDRLRDPNDPHSEPAPEPGLMLADLIPGASVADPTPRGGSEAGSITIPRFVDEAEVAGLRFVYDNDQSDLRRLPETMGGGLALIDYDGDGRLDVYCVQGGPLMGGSSSPTSEGGDRLFRNNEDGTFVDVTEESGIASFARGFGHGVTVADVDNDGNPDLFVTRWGRYALYRNRGDGTFGDVTEEAGLGGDRGWPTSAAFADLDGDGDLDLYVCHYLDWEPDRDDPCPDPARAGRFMYCVPRRFEAENDRVYRNDDGVFVDVTDEAGIVDPEGRGLGVVAADLDGDGLVDLFVANDMTADLLFRNLGDFRFEEVGELSGVSSNADGGYQAGMGIACGDLDGDGLIDLAVTNFYGESTSVFRNLGGGQFAYASGEARLTAPTRFVLGFGLASLDANNDGLLDLAQANGHVNDFRPGTPYAMPSQLFLGTGGGRLIEVSGRAGECWSVGRVGRGMAVGDLDNDGKPDLLILAQNGPLGYFRNLGAEGQGGDTSTTAAGHFLTVQLEGRESNRDGVGARVSVETARRTQVAHRIGGGSFLSSGDPRLHFGLGSESSPVSVEVQWPSGRVDRVENLPVDAAYRLVEGNSHPRSLEGWPTTP